MRRCAPLVGRHVLARLVRGGVGGIRGEMGQACFKTLSMLFKSQVHVFGVSKEGREGGGSDAGDGGKRGRRRRGNLFGLSTKQLRALLVVLQMAVAETEHQNATFTLIKAVVSQKVVLPEVCVCVFACVVCSPEMEYFLCARWVVLLLCFGVIFLYRNL